MTTSTAVRVRALTKRYGAVAAVDGIDLDIDHGEVVALLGPNGAGKTTTVEILEGHRRRDSGEVSVLGADPGTAGVDWRRDIGIVLQDASDAGELTVAETVRHFARYFPDSRRPRRADREGRPRRSVATPGSAQLSGGQRRRLDVAVGIVGRPRLLFLDEPTTGFDPAARRDFWTLIRQLPTTTTIVLTTHDAGRGGGARRPGRGRRGGPRRRRGRPAHARRPGGGEGHRLLAGRRAPRPTTRAR